MKPSIEKLIIKTVKAETQINELSAGTVDVLAQISGGDDINAGLNLVDEGKAGKNTYFRTVTERFSSTAPSSLRIPRMSVRPSLTAWIATSSRDSIPADTLPSSMRLMGWRSGEYNESRDFIDENLNTYEKDINKAKELLAADGWNLNAEGGEYQDGDGVRYKEVDGELVPLVIEWANTEGNPVSDLLSTMLPEAMEEAGMQLNATTMDFPTLSSCISHQGDKIYNMYNLATGFASAHSPWYYYSTDDST